MSDQKYSGWTNYETWNVKLWMDNDQNSYDYWRETTREAWEQAKEDRRYPSQTRKDSTLCILSEALKNYHGENTPTVTGVYADLLNAALSEVNWYEIAESLVDDEEFEENGTAEEEESA